jgi:hypothetical protein
VMGICVPVTWYFSQPWPGVLPVILPHVGAGRVEIRWICDLVRAYVCKNLSPLNLLSPRETVIEIKIKSCCSGFVFGFGNSFPHATGRFMKSTYPIPHKSWVTWSLLYSELLKVLRVYCSPQTPAYEWDTVLPHEN